MSLPSLLDAHAALAHLAYAVRETLKPLYVFVKVEWAEDTYLSVKIECQAKDKQQVVDRLKHGALVEDYDYRFDLSYPVIVNAIPTEWLVVTAYPNMSHDHKRKQAA